jgi:uncharacterized phage protein (TIGR01671 family)
MKEIKFRFYQKTHEQMCNWDYVKGYKVAALEDNQDGDSYSSWMQFTGLKDKKGKEIYEGDIIIGDSYGEYPLIIKWDNEYTGFYCHDPKGDYDDHLNMQEAVNGEVIGNIYENPELLGK